MCPSIGSRDLMVRLGVSLAAACNVMIFSLCYYLGLTPADGVVYPLFGKINLGLATRDSFMSRALHKLNEVAFRRADLLVVLDKDMRIVRVNRRFEFVTGRSRERVNGMPIRDEA